MGLKKEEKASGIKAYWPVLGFIMLVMLGIVAYILAPEVINLAKRTFPSFRGTELPALQMRLGFTFMVFVVFLAITGAILAAFAPKRALNVREGDLAKERKEMIDRKAMERKRQRKINSELRNK
jgi:hypothetical protein